jgi:hypothetical protein
MYIQYGYDKIRRAPTLNRIHRRKFFKKLEKLGGGKINIQNEIDNADVKHSIFGDDAEVEMLFPYKNLSTDEIEFNKKVQKIKEEHQNYGIKKERQSQNEKENYRVKLNQHEVLNDNYEKGVSDEGRTNYLSINSLKKKNTN